MSHNIINPPVHGRFTDILGKGQNTAGAGGVQRHLPMNPGVKSIVYPHVLFNAPTFLPELLIWDSKTGNQGTLAKISM